MSLYGQYIQERLGESIVEEKWGFATFSFLDDGCYIKDIYVSPEFREQGNAAHLADRIAEIAKGRGCKYLYGSVVPSANYATRSAKVLLSYGFALYGSKENFVIFRKDL